MYESRFQAVLFILVPDGLASTCELVDGKTDEGNYQGRYKSLEPAADNHKKKKKLDRQDAGDGPLIERNSKSLQTWFRAALVTEARKSVDLAQLILSGAINRFAGRADHLDKTTGVVDWTEKGQLFRCTLPEHRRPAGRQGVRDYRRTAS